MKFKLIILAVFAAVAVLILGPALITIPSGVATTLLGVYGLFGFVVGVVAVLLGLHERDGGGER